MPGVEPVVYDICVDWDCADWAGAHDFTTEGDDISIYVKSFRITRGAQMDQRVYPAATLELTLKNIDGRFYPTLATGPYFGKIRLWLPVRVRATYDSTTYPLYYGYINRISAYPIKNRQEAYFYATDGSDVLAKSIMVQDMDTKVTQTDGASIAEVLDAAGWSSTRRDIDVDGGNITTFPDTVGFK